MKIFSAFLCMIATVAAADLQTVSLKTIDGETTTLKSYAGKALLIVNVASECGYRGQYEGLQALHDRYAAKGFCVLAFPCNDFGGQEPGSETEIKNFCTSRYQVTFPLFEKVSLKGDDAHPLFIELMGEAKVQWNFEKFLVGKDGKLIARFDSGAEPVGGEIEEAVKAALAK